MKTRFLCFALIVSASLGIANAAEFRPQSDGQSTSDGSDLPDNSAPKDMQAPTEHHNLYINTINDWAQNPALRFDAFSTTYGELGIFANKRREHSAFIMQEGNMQYDMGIAASSYRRLGKSHHSSSNNEVNEENIKQELDNNNEGNGGSEHKQLSLNSQPSTLNSNPSSLNPQPSTLNIVWGSASYEFGKRKNVEWNASSDWAVIYPYVLADSIGGDRNTERYSFEGGCATRFGQWTIGEQLTFRAEHEWSTHDPRMRGIVTDLKAHVGASRMLLDHYLALGGMLKLYKQTNSVEFYREEGRVAEYQMSGLGNWYERFSGTNDKAYYKSTGYALDLDVVPAAGKGGLLLNAIYDYSPVRRILSSLNALPIQRLYVTRWNARIGWQLGNGSAVCTKPHGKKPMALSLWMGLSGEKRRGDEIIGGESTADEYVVRGYLTMYKNRLTDIYGGACWVSGIGRNHLITLLIQGGRQKYTSSFAFPSSSLDFCKNHVGAKLQWQTRGRRWSLDTNVACEFFNNNSGSYTTLEEASYESPLAEDIALVRERMIDRCTAQALASYTQLAMNVRGHWAPQFMGSIGLYAEVGAIYRSNDTLDTNKGYILNASLGITF